MRLVSRGWAKLHSVWVANTYPFSSIGRNVWFHPTTKVTRQRAARISLGSSVKLLESVWINVATDDPYGEPTVVIEDGCSIGYCSIISGKNRVHLERDVLVGQHVVIQDHNHEYEDVEVPIIKQGITEGGTIRIGEGSWIGHGAAILCSRGELSIGRHCVVSANSVVLRSVPDYSVVFGMPAKIIRQYNPNTRSWQMGQVRGVSGADRDGGETLSTVRRDGHVPEGVLERG
ncbi:MAG TPA: acyltransferase [Candidatus Eisenbacteria bacterium]|nr:acyltransferase [Candidatus Eisenbacteria bacterium]